MSIPARLAHRPRDRRGYVVPFVQLIDKHGEPQFKVMDDELVQRAVTHRLCGLCGAPMGRHIFFVGGALCVANGYFYDPPMHRECAEYALRTCPHMAHTGGGYGRVPEAAELGIARVGVAAHCSDQKSAAFALMHGERYTYGRTGDGMLVIKAQLPWREVVYWHEGKPL